MPFSVMTMCSGDVRAAARDVAIADAEFVAQLGDPVLGIQRMHFERRQPDEEARADELVAHLVIAQDVADVLA